MSAHRDTAPKKPGATPHPPTPDVPLHAAHYEGEGKWVVVEASVERDAWIEIDEDHMCAGEDWA